MTSHRALLLSALAASLTGGCVSSRTWSAWHEVRDRVETLESESLAPGDEADPAAPADLAFATCDDVAREAVRRSPGLAAPRERARSALAMARAEGALPAPSVDARVWDFPIGDPSMADREGMYMLGAAQELPPADALDASARALVEEARGALGELDEMRREISTETLHACADWAGAEARARRLVAFVEVLRTMRLVVEARLSAGGGSVADVARVEREIAMAERMFVETTAAASAAAETLRAWMGVPTETELGAAPALPSEAPAFRGDAVLSEALARRGTLGSLRAGVDAAEARARAASARAEVPTFMIGAMYMQTPQARAGMGLEIGLTLPWLWSGEGDAAEAARAEARAMESELEGAERRVEVEVRGALARLEAAGRILSSLRDREAPAARLALDATAATYGAGAGTLLEWLDAARSIRELEVDEADLLSEILHAVVEVAAAMGGLVADIPLARSDEELP